MALLAEADSLPLGDYVTIDQGAKLKETNYQALRRWIARHDIEVKRVGKVLVVSKTSLNKYNKR
jgi:hypothetical protein